MHKSIRDWDETDLTLAVYALRRRGMLSLKQASGLLTQILDGTIPFPACDAPRDGEFTCNACGRKHDPFVGCQRNYSASQMRPDKED